MLIETSDGKVYTGIALPLDAELYECLVVLRGVPPWDSLSGRVQILNGSMLDEWPLSLKEVLT